MRILRRRQLDDNTNKTTNNRNGQKQNLEKCEQMNLAAEVGFQEEFQFRWLKDVFSTSITLFSNRLK